MWRTQLQRITSKPHLAAAWAIRGALLFATLQMTAQRLGYVVAGPLQQVETQHPITCVHTRLTDEVEEWKIQRTMQMAREMGATTIVEFFPWPYIEPQQGVYNWWHSDMIVRHARAQGLTVIARLGMVPEWAQPYGEDIDQNTSLTHLEPHRFADFGHFVGVFAEHYKDDIDHIIIWNEPNLAYEWGYQEVLPQNYMSVLQFAYPAAHKANPDVVILAGALAPTLEPVGSPYGMNELDYLRQLYEWGAAPYFDALAIHTYGFKFPPEEPPAPDVLNFRRAELLREIMVEYGDGEKPVYITESGWNDHPRWTKAVRPGQRITYTLDALQYAEDNWPWLDNLCIWVFRTPAPAYSYPDYFTLVSPDFTPKPIYDEIQRWARGWPEEAAP
jgi:polysaccharide biosynthesis protein PslG